MKRNNGRLFLISSNVFGVKIFGLDNIFVLKHLSAENVETLTKSIDLHAVVLSWYCNVVVALIFLIDLIILQSIREKLVGIVSI